MAFVKTVKIFQVSCDAETRDSVESELARTKETAAGYFKRLHRENLERINQAASVSPGEASLRFTENAAEPAE